MIQLMDMWHRRGNTGGKYNLIVEPCSIYLYSRPNVRQDAISFPGSLVSTPDSSILELGFGGKIRSSLTCGTGRFAGAAIQTRKGFESQQHTGNCPHQR